MIACLFAAALLQAAAAVVPADSSAQDGARNPSYAADGRLAVSRHGNLWVRDHDGTWTRVTHGAWVDREPAWTARGDSMVFSSDRGGHFSLWVVAASGGAPRQITHDAEDDGEPAVAPDGTIYFIRGVTRVGRLWERAPDGDEHRVAEQEDAESWPAASTRGDVAYVTTHDGTGHLHVRSANAHGVDREIASGPGLMHPSWSPDAARLTYTVAGAHGGVYVTPVDGGYENLVSRERAESAWNPDGRHLTLVERPPADVSYNGDPNRLGDRDAYDAFAPGGRLWDIDAPVAPDAARASIAAPPVNRTERNADTFDRFFARETRLYFTGADAAARRARWDSLRAPFRARAIAARDDDELRGVLHAMLEARPPLRNDATGRAAVSSASPVATAAGLEILREGGNVVDAAVAVSFALAVAEPDASGPGGYGQMLVYRRGMPEPHLIEFMTRVPEDASLEKLPELPTERPGMTNVPGTVAGMYHAWQLYGSRKIPWAQLLAPAIRAATTGYLVSDGLATTLATDRDQFLKYPGARALFFRNGEPLHAGDTLRNPDLAWTLRQIAERGADGFYQGEVAKRMVDDLRQHGNVMKLSDLSRYYAADREPVSGTYRGYTLYSTAPPVAGGAELVSTLNMLSHVAEPGLYTDDAHTLNAMIQAWQLVPSTRGRIADPGLWPVNLEPFTSVDTANARWRCSDPDHALAPAAVRGDSVACAGSGIGAAPKLLDVDTPERDWDPKRSMGTTAFMVADGEGNVVAVTQTLGTWGGTFYVTPGLGFLYNDKLGSYSDDSTAYGARLPFARHGSTIAPTIIFKGSGASRAPFAAVGAAGNAWITAGVYETIVGMLDDHLGPQAALELPRFLLGGRRGAGRDAGVPIQMEDGFSPAVMERLRAMGYDPRLVSLIGELREGYGAAIMIHDGQVTAGADPRRSGTAGAIH
ncbi:MAG: gamma-glutamyltransferase [Gemmatimonadota bacterium]|nr:gamma-glutamyltransferase [Gemmatimonadota bacterium]